MRDPFDVLGRQPEPTQPPSPAFAADLMAAVEERLDSNAESGTAAAAPPRSRAVAVIDPEVARMHRQPSPSRRWLLVAAGVVLLAGVALVLTRNRSDDTENPAGVPTTVASPVDQGAQMPLALQERWMGGNRDFVPAEDAGVSLLFGRQSYRMAQSNQNDTSPVNGSAVPVGADRFEVTSGNDALGCDAATSGSYRWSLSTTGRVLTIAAVSDPCVDRVAALAGTYWRTNCFDANTNCLGALDAGEYASQYIRPLEPLTATWEPVFGGVRYTVPDGWANTTEYPYVLGLGWADEYAAVTEAKPFPPHEVNLVGKAHLDAGNSCENAPLDRHPSAAAFLDAFEARPGITLSEPVPVTVGGLSGLQVDVTADRSAYVTCDGQQWLPLVVGGEFGYAAEPDQAVRLIVLDSSPDDDNGLTAVIIQGTAAGWDRFLSESMAIIESMQFT